MLPSRKTPDHGGSARRAALGGMLGALSIVVLVLGSFLGIATYAAPMAAAVLIVPVRHEYGRGMAAVLWVAVSLLALMLVPERELALFYALAVGWYPAVQPVLNRLPKRIGLAVKAALFAAVNAALYGVVMSLLGVSVDSTGLLAVLCLTLTFCMMMLDKILNKVEWLYTNRWRKRLFGSGGQDC